jgi:glucosylceramidase
MYTGMRSITSLTFGNVICTTTSDLPSDETCSSSTDSPAKIYINSKKTFQSILGFGGAFTETAAYNFYKLPQKVQDKVIDLYFGQNGIGFTLGRVHIGSCDFSLSEYSFNNIADDYYQTYFDTEVTHDNAQMLPFMRLAIEAARKRSKSSKLDNGNGVNILASPWSPPPWMKKSVNGVQSMSGSAIPEGLIDDPRIKDSYARYLSKFITAYEKKGVPIWAITPQVRTQETHFNIIYYSTH